MGTSDVVTYGTGDNACWYLEVWSAFPRGRWGNSGAPLSDLACTGNFYDGIFRNKVVAERAREPKDALLVLAIQITAVIMPCYPVYYFKL